MKNSYGKNRAVCWWNEFGSENHRYSYPVQKRKLNSGSNVEGNYF